MTAPERPRPTSLQDLQNLLGVELGPTRWHLVDQAIIDGFADITGDRQWIHVEPARAAESPFGSTIAHGLYSLSLTPALLEELMAFDGFAHSLNYGYDRVRFIHPLPVNSRIRLRAELITVEQTPNGQIHVVTRLTIEAEGIDKPILVADSIGRFSA
ncbi:MaoC family dehydratase [Gephyromycinifex aptenodytis]|uniref:MaoC family dehydratase n=1 Tax=Gephyromycinifex aptenodytis TaxID=2716227 RepID=UPI001447A81A|nr:MaoC family dehydratase [Gephyromycinifex aptenodytis]